MNLLRVCLFLVGVTCVYPLGAFAARTCDQVFEKSEIEVTDPALLQSGRGISLRNQTESPNLSQRWQYASLFGDFEILISQQPDGVQWGVVQRDYEDTAPVRDLLHILLNHHFGENHVGYPKRPDGTVAEHLFVNVPPESLKPGYLEAVISDVKSQLLKVPSRVKTSPQAIMENPSLIQDLKSFAKEHFPFMTQKDFASRAIYFLPYFVQKQPNHLNFALNADVFSTRNLTDDPGLSQLLSFSLQQRISVKRLREQLRKRFILEFEQELRQLSRYQMKLDVWNKIQRHPLVLEIHDYAVVLSKAALNTLPRHVDLLVSDYQSSSAETGQNRGTGRLPIEMIAVRFKDQYLPKLIELESKKYPAKRAYSRAERNSVFWSESPSRIRRLDLMVSSFAVDGISARVTSVPLHKQGRDSLEASTRVGQDVNFENLVQEIGVDRFYEDEASLQSTSLSRLLVSSTLRSKIIHLPGLEVIESIKRFSARQLVDRYGLNREDMIELLTELDVHAIHLEIDHNWDESTFNLRRELPQYYESRHAPGRNSAWYNPVPSDAFFNQ